MTDKKLKPCPFCGGKVKFLILDDEFNIKDEDYAKDPWSGLQYGLCHDTKEEAAEAWNRRVNDG